MEIAYLLREPADLTERSAIGRQVRNQYPWLPSPARSCAFPVPSPPQGRPTPAGSAARSFE